MALHIKGKSIGVAWSSLLWNLLYTGTEYSPRGMKTREILNVCLEVTEGLDNVLISPMRDINYRFMIAEWLWIQAGLQDVETIALYNSVMRNFSDDGFILSGAYGPRLCPQLSYVLESLSKEDSRQAVATIWTPSPTSSKDIPCTISLQWFIRKGKLHSTINMRSSDVWLGIPYDFFNFSQITNMLASILMKPVGSITMNLGSSHIYENNWEKAELVLRCSEKSTYSITSPALTREYLAEVVVPCKETIQAMLQRDPSVQRQLADPWDKYALALTKDKSFALEVLRELSSK